MATIPTQNAVPSEAPRDLKFNSGKIDEFVTSLEHEYKDRFGRCHMTIEGMKWMFDQLVLRFKVDMNQAIISAGYITVDSFQQGAQLPDNEITQRNQILRDETTGEYYRWDGELPKSVPAGSTPESSGGIGMGAWVSVGDASLRGELSKPTGADLIGTESGKTVQEFLIANDSAEYRAKNIAKLAWVDYQVHNQGKFGVCFLGDSMTAGCDRTSSDVIPPQDGDWETRASMNYPYRFAEYLKEQSGSEVDPFVMRAVTGYTAMQAFSNQAWQVNPYCDVAIIMFGINDSGSGEEGHIDVYMDYMEKLIRRYIDWGCAIVVQIPTHGGQGAGDPAWLYWAKRMRMMASIYGCAVFNGHEVNLYRHAASVQSDGVHFNSMGYAIHGEKLASMFMAGGLNDTYRPVTNETLVWPGMMSDSIGWCDAMKNISTSRSDSAYTRSKIIGGMPAGSKSLMSFSFYLDAEAAHIYGKLEGKIITNYSSGKNWNNNAKPYYQQATDQVTSFGGGLNRNVKSSDTYGTWYVKGASRFVGRLIGRGWHTITFHRDTDDAQYEAYVNSITVQPIPIGLSVEQMWGQDEERRYKVVHSRKFPSPSGMGEVLAQPVTLTQFHMRAPQCVLGTGPGVAAASSPFFYNTVPAKLIITNEKGWYIECLVSKTSGTDGSFKVSVLKSTIDQDKTPSISCSIATAERNTIVAAGAYGNNQPIENIYDYNARIHKQNFTSGDIAYAGGIYLIFDITWPGQSPSGYWNVEVEGGDWFGNSESSFGSY